ncbi:hypothetical protein LGM43_15235 [Burkholderia seminalis]|uniref:hypothetical protein n=1 Tax=Burkholderia seminalis TaxID=488731 RepID=UPI001CF3DEBB|nr:hypothetical protein [Burkholderia seminalis]MCA7951620.1 hypothetical protein [Burkholderia seminalis]
MRLLPGLEPEPQKLHVDERAARCHGVRGWGTTNGWRSLRTQRHERSGTPVRFHVKPAITTRIVSARSIKYPKSGFSRSIAPSIDVNATGDWNAFISQYVTACRKD